MAAPCSQPISNSVIGYKDSSRAGINGRVELQKTRACYHTRSAGVACLNQQGSHLRACLADLLNVIAGSREASEEQACEQGCRGYSCEQPSVCLRKPNEPDKYPWRFPGPKAHKHVTRSPSCHGVGKAANPRRTAIVVAQDLEATDAVQLRIILLSS